MSTVENKIYGFPYVVILTRRDRMTVQVIQHARTLSEAMDTMHFLRTQEHPGEVDVVDSRDLTRTLNERRDETAAALNDWPVQA